GRAGQLHRITLRRRRDLPRALEQRAGAVGRSALPLDLGQLAQPLHEDAGVGTPQGFGAIERALQVRARALEVTALRRTTAAQRDAADAQLDLGLDAREHGLRGVE